MSSPQDLRDRTKSFAVRIVRLYRSLPYKADAQVLGKQLLRSGTAVAANYRAACRARSGAEWIAKIGIVVEEADESLVLARNVDRLPTCFCQEIAGVDQGRTRTKRHIYRITAYGKNSNEVNYKLPITKLQISQCLT
jgi:four helix bundle protein